MPIYYNSTLIKRLQAYRLFVFDLDRTLVETEWDYLLQVVHLTIQRCGGKFVPTREQIQHFWIGNIMSRDEFIKRVLRLKPVNFWREHQALDTVANRIIHTKAIGGVEENLRWLVEVEKMTAVITAARPMITQAQLRLFEFQFDNVLSVSDHPALAGKPEPDGLHFMMLMMGCAPEETVYIGDSAEDYNFARAAGVDFIHYQNGGFSFLYQDPPLVVFNDWRNSPFLRM